MCNNSNKTKPLTEDRYVVIKEIVYANVSALNRSVNCVF